MDRCYDVAAILLASQNSRMLIFHQLIIGAVTGKDPMLVMEYMEHGSLYDILHNEVGRGRAIHF